MQQFGDVAGVEDIFACKAGIDVGMMNVGQKEDLPWLTVSDAKRPTTFLTSVYARSDPNGEKTFM